jgi:centromeric protein E
VRAGVEAEGAVLVASLNLVDLAGSESVRHTGATGQRAKEGGNINKSLLSLSRVIHALSQPGTHVSFRDSKLTRLLQPSLSGNAKMAVVCCVTPSEKYIEETRSTLQFASRAKLVKTHATVNEVVDDATKLKRLKTELEQLKDKQRLSGGMTEEEGARIEYEKKNLLSRLETLQREKDQQKVLHFISPRLFSERLP